MATSPAPNPALSARLRDRRFYFFVTILTAAIVFAGFARTFFLNGWFAKLHLSPLFILHGVIFSSWLVVLVTQSMLVSAKKIHIHKKLGYASLAIVTAMFALGWMMSVRAAQRGFTPPGGPPPTTFFAFQLLGLFAFVAFIGAGYLFRNRPETHKRLMVSGTVLILTPAVARIFLLFTSDLVIFKAFGVQLAVLLACMAYDYVTRKRIHPAYLTAAVTLLALLPVSGLIGSTPLWQAIAHRISGV
jgi:hypothetical protein